MKICFIFSNLHLAHITGQPAMVLRLARYAVKRDEKVYIISNISEKMQLGQNGINFFLINGLANLKTYFLNLFKIIKYIRTIRPDIIYVHGHQLIIFIWFVNRFFNIPLVCSICEILDRKMMNVFFRKLLIFCLLHSKATFVTSQYLKRQLVQDGIPSDKIVVSRIGLDEKFLIEKTEFSPDTDILYYGDSNRERGFDIIFQLAKKLPKLKFKVLLRWEGKNCRNELEKMKKMSNVIIWYYPYSESLEQIILKSKSVILPYRWMSMRPPISLLESMALGKCVISSTMEGNDEIITNRLNGLMIDLDELDKATSDISILIKDNKQREDIGQQAKKTIRQMYSLAEYDKILDRCSTILRFKGEI